MIAEEKVINIELRKEIELTCKKCGETQKYHPRDNTIPKRPKTQCQNEKCSAWIYFDGSLLVKDDQKKTKNDQKKEQKKPLKPKQKSTKNQKPKKQSQSELTKKNDQKPEDHDQMTKTEKNAKSIKENRNAQEIAFIGHMSQEIQIYGRTIPFDKVREIARKTLEHSRNMIKGIKTYQNAWESRYKDYKTRKPNNFLIDEFESMQETLEFLKEMKELNKKLKNREGVD